MTSLQPTAHCTVCSKEATKTCAPRCAAKYCSEACQEHDGKLHKLLCAAFQNPGKRPQGQYHLAIVFPVNEQLPRLEYVSQDSPSRVEPLILGNDEPWAEWTELVIDRNEDGELDRTLHITYRENFLYDKSKPNQSILHLANGTPGDNWRGPVFAARWNKPPHRDWFPKDITLADLRHVADFFDWHDWYGIDNKSCMRTTQDTPMIKAVKAACDGDQTTCNARPLVSVNLPPKHPALEHGEVSTISQRLGFPLAFFKLPTRFQSVDINGPHCNEGITFAMVEENPMSEWWGWVPLHWTGGEVPTCFVLRKDARPVVAQQVEAFLHFCQFKLCPLLVDLMKEGEEDRNAVKDKVLGYLSKPHFEAFFEEYRKKRINQLAQENADDERKVWESVQCPTRV